MKLSFVTAAAALLAPSAFAGIIIDGTLDPSYGVPLSVQTENPASAFGGGNWLDAIYASDDATNLYIYMEGTVTDNAFVFWLDVPSEAGDAPTPLPPATGGGGAAAATAGGQGVNTLELAQVDYAFAGNQPTSVLTSFFADGVDYLDAVGPNDADGLGSDVVVNLAVDTSVKVAPFSTTHGTASVEYSYSDGDTNGVAAAPTTGGFEILIPKALIGAENSYSVNLFAALTNKTGFFSRHVLPSATGHGNFNIGGPGADFLTDTPGTGGSGTTGGWGTQILPYFMAVAPVTTAAQDWNLYQ